MPYREPSPPEKKNKELFGEINPFLEANLPLTVFGKTLITSRCVLWNSHDYRIQGTKFHISSYKEIRLQAPIEYVTSFWHARVFCARCGHQLKKRGASFFEKGHELLHVLPWMIKWYELCRTNKIGIIENNTILIPRAVYNNHNTHKVEYNLTKTELKLETLEAIFNMLGV